VGRKKPGRKAELPSKRRIAWPRWTGKGAIKCCLNALRADKKLRCRHRGGEPSTALCATAAVPEKAQAWI
jgi:hypothetical protein